jgi:glycosyltransferase involved in cell wall biosynthesis
MPASTAQRPIRIVLLSSLYPNAQHPRHGIFVEQRLRHLVASGAVEAKVVAPVPWFWSTHPRYGRYARMAAVAPAERRYGLDILHPRYIVVPKVGMTLGPASMARSAGRTLARLRQQGFDFDLIDAHYFYPDGVAATRLARRFARPVAVTARGTDINAFASMRIPGHQIRAAARRASALIGVSASLSRKLAGLGSAAEKVATLRNGVDLEVFAPMERSTVRAQLGLSGKVWLCVGNLIEGKGMHLAIAALACVPDVTLVIAGDGPEATRLRRQAGRLGIADRVRFVGTVAHTELPGYYNAADALILPSRSEGMPNVVLEALACGTAVLATAVGGIPEIMVAQVAGRLLRERTAAAITTAWQSLAADEIAPSGRAERRQYAEQFGWEPTTQGQIRIFRQMLAGGAA